LHCYSNFQNLEWCDDSNRIFTHPIVISVLVQGINALINILQLIKSICQVCNPQKCEKLDVSNVFSEVIGQNLASQRAIRLNLCKLSKSDAEASHNHIDCYNAGANKGRNEFMLFPHEHVVLKTLFELATQDALF
jgi:hypothetical protein